MAYDKKDLEDKAIKAIKDNNLFFIQDVIAFLPCASSTFYGLEMEKLESIKESIFKEKTNAKIGMRKKWYDSENATLQMGLMKLLSTDEELRKLSMQTNAHEGEITTNIISLGSGVKPNETTS
jgi:hypothetical protein